MEFQMKPQSRGRFIYLWLSVLPVLLGRILVSHLKLIYSNPVFLIALSVCIIALCLLLPCYFLLLRKSHEIHVQVNQVTEVTWRGEYGASFSTSRIRSVRRNFLKEIILLDENGTKLMTVESYMTNFDQFECWLKEHNKL